MKTDYIKLSISFLLFFAALIFKDYSFILYVIAYAISGYKVIFSAISNIFRGQIFDENFLMSIATIGAFLIGEYAEAVAVILFFEVGELFQASAVNKSRKSISSLLEIMPDHANLLINNEETKVDPDDLKIDDIIIIKAGEKIPVDCIIIDGSSSLNTSALTGESLPLSVYTNDEISSGCINITGKLIAKVTKTYENSTVSKILELVQNASDKKSKTENFITKFAKYYTPIVVILAVIIAVIPPLLIPSAEFKDYIYRALTFLVVSCPCALVISVPLGFFGGIGRASKSGILVKGSSYLENLSKVETIVFDKTGTLTKGNFAVTHIENIQIEKEDLLYYVAYAEKISNHPIANSVLKHYNKEIDISKISSAEELSGFGIIANISGKNILVGNEKLMQKFNIDFKTDDFIGTKLYVSIDSVFKGYIGINDEIKENTKETLQELKNLGIKTVMLTGDNEKIAEKVANDLGIDKYYAKLLPSDKVTKFEEILKNSTGKVAFVGDGINDAPVLTRSDIGISMGGLGSDSAIEASDVVIIDDNLSKIAKSIQISNKTMRIVKQNITLSLIVKILVLILGTFGLSTLWQGIIADVGVAILAILNSIRMINSKI